MSSGFIHIYCGDGKGKTTAATGLALRCAGCGGQVLFARFLKNQHSGELKALAMIPGIEIINPQKSFGFFNTLSENEKVEMKLLYEDFWKEITEKIDTGHYTMLVMDEFMASYNYGVLNQESVFHFLQTKPEGLEVVLTGRNPAEELKEMAAYISEVTKIKHPFDQGIKARRGIEF